MSRRLLTLDDVARRPEPGMDAPGSAVFAPDGRSITCLYSPDGSLVRSLWRHDLASGERVEIAVPLPETTREETLSRADHLLRERTGAIELGVTSFAWAGDSQEPTLLVPMDGRLFVAFGREIERGIHEIPGVDHAGGAALSPDGAFVSFSMGGDLYVAAVRGGPPRRITHDAEEGVFNGLAEFAAAEELGRFEGAWWSADSQFLAFAHVDERAIPQLTITHESRSGSEQGDEVHHYPFAGGPNARVTLRIASISDSAWREVPLPMQADDYLARVLADPAGGWLVAVLPRAQRTLEWLRVGEDGATEALWTEESEPWINLDDDTRVLADGRILRSTERSGFRHLELRSAAGDLQRVLTRGEWAVTSVVTICERRGEVLFTATRDGVLERHLYAVALDPAEPITDPERLSTDAGWHTVVAAADGERWIDTWSDLRHAPRITVETREGDSVLIHASSMTAEDAQLRPPELVELLAADERTPLYAAIYRAGAAGGASAPTVLWVYGGPHWQYVRNEWELTVFGLRQYLAQQGATVVVVDSRGTESRGLAFESAVNRQMGLSEVADQATALRQLAARGELDLGRVGVVGASYGGFLSIMAMAREPDLFGTAVAVAPVSEWTGYDSAYTERYLGLPSDNPDGYRESSALTHVGAVQGDLLLIHGTVDENVHRRHSERLVTAFRKGGRKVELVRLPEQRHRTRGGAIRVREQRTIAHLLRGLGLPLPEELD